MKQNLKRLRRLFTLVGMASAIAIAFVPASSFSAEVQKAVIATVAADYTSGAHCVADVDPVGGPRAIQTDLLPTISDIMVAAYENYFYRLERYQGDNVTKFDIAAPEAVIYQYSVKDDPEETDSANPSSLIFLNAEKAYLLRYGKSTAWIVNPSAETEEEFKIGELDLSAYADSDGIPEMENGVIVDGVLYITMQRLDRNNNWAPTNTSYVALFDTATDLEIDTETENDDDVKGVALPIRNTGVIQYLDANDTLYIQAKGDWYGSFYGREDRYTGGIITLDPDTYATTLLVDDGDDDNHPYGHISGLSVVSADKGYFTGGDAGVGEYSLYGFSPTTGDVSGTVDEYLTGKNIAGMQSGAYPDDNGMLWVCNQTDAEVVVLNTADDTIDEKVSTNLNPIMVAFASADDDDDDGNSSDDDDDSTCFIDSLSFGLFK